MAITAKLAQKEKLIGETIARLRVLGISEMGCLQFKALTPEQQSGLAALIEQYVPNPDGNLRNPEAQ